jgi:hypothetical protein
MAYMIAHRLTVVSQHKVSNTIKKLQISTRQPPKISMLQRWSYMQYKNQDCATEQLPGEDWTNTKFEMDQRYKTYYAWQKAINTSS